MARKKRRASYCRLDKRERKAIEHGLDGRESCRSMARDLGRSASTIHDEVVRNRVVTRGPGKGDNVSGTDGSQAGDVRVCPKLLSWPFCRDGCKYRRYHCSHRWRCEYLAAHAQVFADEDQVEPRRGVDMDRDSALLRGRGGHARRARPRAQAHARGLLRR